MMRLGIIMFAPMAKGSRLRPGSSTARALFTEYILLTRRIVSPVSAAEVSYCRGAKRNTYGFPLQFSLPTFLGEWPARSILRWDVRYILGA